MDDNDGRLGRLESKTRGNWVRFQENKYLPCQVLLEGGWLEKDIGLHNDGFSCR